MADADHAPPVLAGAREHAPRGTNGGVVTFRSCRPRFQRLGQEDVAKSGHHGLDLCDLHVGRK